MAGEEGLILWRKVRVLLRPNKNNQQSMTTMVVSMRVCASHCPLLGQIILSLVDV